MPSLPRYLLTEGRLLEPWRARGLPRGRRLDSGWEGGGFLGTAARRLAAWPLWLVHLSGSRVVRFSGCSRCVRLSACPFVDLSICRSVLPSFCASVLLSLCPSVLLSLWCTLTVLSIGPSVLLSFCPSVLSVHLLDAVSKALGCSSARCGFMLLLRQCDVKRACYSSEIATVLTVHSRDARDGLDRELDHGLDHS